MGYKVPEKSSNLTPDPSPPCGEGRIGLILYGNRNFAFKKTGIEIKF
jgi:hypothetical protein